MKIFITGSKMYYTGIIKHIQKLGSELLYIYTHTHTKHMSNVKRQNFLAKWLVSQFTSFDVCNLPQLFNLLW